MLRLCYAYATKGERNTQGEAKEHLRSASCVPQGFLMVSSRFPQGSNAWSKQGAEHVFAGRKTRVCWERNGILPDSGARPYILGRPPVYLRAGGLICASARPNPLFYYPIPTYHYNALFPQAGNHLIRVFRERRNSRTFAAGNLNHK